jgi:hypothetical protein
MTTLGFMTRGGTDDDLHAIAVEVARGLASADAFGGRAFVRTPLLLPSGASIVVAIEPEGSGLFRISDFGQVLEEADTLEFGRIYRRQLDEIAAVGGFTVDDGALVLDGLGRTDLVGASMSLASALLRAVDRAMVRAAERRPQTAADNLVQRLQRLFSPERVRAQAEFRGESTHAWLVDAIVETQRGVAIFDLVSPAPVSVAFAAAKFHDFALLERPPARIAVVRRKEAFGNLLQVVAQAAKVVQEDASDGTIERLARAA